MALKSLIKNAVKGRAHVSRDYMQHIFEKLGIASDGCMTKEARLDKLAMGIKEIIAFHFEN